MKILNASIAVCSVAIMLFFTQCRKDNTPAVPINKAPIANANNPVTNMPKDSVELDGSRSIDPDGDPITYKWTYIIGPNVSVIRKNTDAKTFVANLNVGIYKFLLTVTDNKGASSIDTATVIVNPKGANQSPTANAGMAQATTLPKDSVELDGSASMDPDGNIIKYQWTCVNGPMGSIIRKSTEVKTFVANLKAGSYVFRLTVTDNSMASATNDVTVTVNAAPVNTKIIGSFAGYYSANSANTFKFNITPLIENTTVDMVLGGTTPYNSNKTTYTYVPGMAGAVDTLKNCSFTIKAPDGSTSTTSFTGIFSPDYKTLIIKGFKLGEGLSSFADFTLTKL